MRFTISLCLLSLLFLSGCAESSDTETSENEASENELPPVMEAPAKASSGEPSVEELMRQLGAGDRGQAQKIGGKIRKVSLFQAGVRDLSPLKGLDLIFLDVTRCPVEDLSPLEGMPLEELYLEETQVDDEDLAVLKGMPLKILYLGKTKVTSMKPLTGLPLTQLNLLDAPVTSIEGVEEMPLETLWVPGTSVSDLSPLQGTNLLSLDIARSEVTSLEPLRELKSLQRLNMEDCEIDDLSPLEDLPLTRLIFYPANVKQGLEMIRNKSSIQELGTDFDSRMPPAQFWAKYEAGEFQ
ncbi:MAG: hypothetical protein HUJ26_03790 [Planctomycetaceae bacterium]|nr:hypothetical protein [Planctomycetaceae bacterium]